MNFLNLLVTSRHLYFKPFTKGKGKEQSNDEETLIEEKSGDFFSQIEHLLSKNPLPHRSRLSFVLDQNYTSYRYFELPEVKRGKIKKILEFELSNNLILDNDEIFYDFTVGEENESKTGVGVFSIKKEFSEKLQDISHEFKLDIAFIQPLTHIIDYDHRREEGYLSNHIYIHFGGNAARIFVYKDGDLIGITVLEPEGEEQLSLKNQVSLENFFFRIDQIISAVLMKEAGIDEVIVNKEISDFIKVKNHELFLEKEVTETEEDLFQAALYECIKNPIVTGRGHVNLLQFENLLFQEIKENLKVFLYTLGMLGISLIFFLGSQFYQIYENQNTKTETNQRYNKRVEEYLPKGVSKSNAAFILEKNVKDLREKREFNQKYSSREYSASSFLKVISALKIKTPSINVRKLTYRKGSVLLSGEVDNFVDIESIKTYLRGNFTINSKGLKVTQKNTKEGKIQFSISFEPIIEGQE